MATPDGIARCAPTPGPMAPPPMTKGCRALGELCAKSPDCCAGGADSCRADANGTLRCLGPSAGSTCLPEGLPCSVAAQCCGGLWCLPDTTGALTCASTCAPTGAPCVALEDCCAGVSGDCLGPAGARVCTHLAGTDGGSDLHRGRRFVRRRRAQLLRRHGLRVAGERRNGLRRALVARSSQSMGAILNESQAGVWLLVVRSWFHR